MKRQRGIHKVCPTTREVSFNDTSHWRTLRATTTDLIVIQTVVNFLKLFSEYQTFDTLLFHYEGEFFVCSASPIFSGAKFVNCAGRFGSFESPAVRFVVTRNAF